MGDCENEVAGQCPCETLFCNKLDNLQPDTLKAFFRWVSNSIKTTSASVAQVAADAPVNLPPPPPQIQIVP
jgi:uncharacterized protein YegL